MLRTAVLALTLGASLGAPPSVEPDPGPRRTALNLTRTLILTFSTWPLDDELAELLEQKLDNAGFHLVRTLPRYRTWLVKPHDWPGPSPKRTCSELMLDTRIGPVLESCESDRMLKLHG